MAITSLEGTPDSGAVPPFFGRTLRSYGPKPTSRKLRDDPGVLAGRVLIHPGSLCGPERLSFPSSPVPIIVFPLRKENAAPVPKKLSGKVPESQG